ncbi:MAG: LptE family protein [Gemmatimonadota bacterium]|nr:LptE family protein [Gemmatimonadota bacterium]
MPAAAALLAVVPTACNYSFQAGSFPPPHVRTIAIEPFENETDRFEVAGELYDELVRSLPGALGVNTAGLNVADAVVRGSVTRYDVQAPNYRAGAGGAAAEVLQREVRIAIRVEIVDRVENVILWESGSETAQGLFAEGAPEEEGRREAIDQLVQAIVDGAQSNW